MDTNAPLIERFMEECVRMERCSAPDGLGGFVSEWAEGERFRAAIIRGSEADARAAQKETVSGEYTVTAAPEVRLSFHDVIRRVSDGAIFRITGTVRRTPEGAGFRFSQARAQAYALTRE